MFLLCGWLTGAAFVLRLSSDRQAEMSYAEMLLSNPVYGIVHNPVFLFYILVLIPPHQVCL